MAVFLKVLEFFDKSGEIMVYKMPEDDGATLISGSQLIVQENQVAIFYKNGQVLDKFTTGKYTISTENLPLLSSLEQMPFKDQSPFSAYVYFLNLKTFYNIGWGTPNPILFKDNFFNLINLRANGSFSIRIAEPEIFLVNMIGTKGYETTYQIELFLKKILIEKLTQVIIENMTSVLDINTKYSIIEEKTKDLVKSNFEKYGIELVNLIIESITLPEEVQKRINESSSMEYKNIGMGDDLKNAVNKNQPTQQQLSNDSKSKCPKCHNPVDIEFVICPICKQKLKKKCINQECNKFLNAEWDVCPFCGSEQ